MTSKIQKNYLPEISAALFGRRKPGMVTVNLTKRCNQHCIYCEIGSNEAASGQDALKVTDLFWIIDQMADSGIPKLSLCGGEPFLYSGIFEVVSHASEKKVYCSITTNGMNLHQLTQQQLDVLKKNGARINISIDSFDEEIQRITRGHPLALKNALRSVDVLKKHELPVTILCAISRFNVHDLSNFVYGASGKGIEEVIFQPIIYFSNYPERQSLENKSDLNVPQDQIPVLLDQLEQIQALEKKINISTNVYRILPWIEHYLISVAGKNGVPFYNRVVPQFYCREVHAVIDISYDGDIQPCGLAPATTNLLDRKDRSLMDLWEEATSPLKHELENNRYPAMCNSCCHKFSRNMMASVIMHPLKNRKALSTLTKALVDRSFHKARKTIKHKMA